MFSNRIANSAKFLQMPSEAQLLYFHMILRADDDGVVESYPIMKLLGTAPDAFKVLVARGYVQQLNEDQVVVISDWLEHNIIRADRKVDSIYKHLLPATIKVIEPRPRSDVEDNSKRLNGQSTDGIGKVRLGKVSINKEVAPLPDWLRKDVWERWVTYRKERKKSMTLSTIEKQIVFLSRYKKWHVDMIEQSIRNGWLGLFELKGKEGQRIEQEPLPEVKGFIDDVTRKFVVEN